MIGLLLRARLNNYLCTSIKIMARRPKLVDLTAIGALDRSSGQLARQLTQALREAVRKGDLQPGEPLPSTRLLAKSLGIARGTVIEAFEQLLAEGVLESRPGAGTRISRSLPDPANRERPIRSPATPAKTMPPPSARKRVG